MFDARLRPIIDPPLNWLAGGCVAVGLTANRLTVIGFFIGLICALFIMLGYFQIALICLALNRLCDGLDGAVARKLTPSEFGGYLDIVCDFLFYAMVPFAFIVHAQANSYAGAFLMLSFVGTGSSFLAYAILEAEHGRSGRPTIQKKSFFYLGGLTEGAETILLFAVVMAVPALFPVLAWIFGGMCWATTCWRVYAAYCDFKE